MKKFTVSEFTKSIKSLIEKTYNEVVSISGEVSNCSKSPSGHIYFVLKDTGSQIKCAFFKNYALASLYIPKNGDKVQAIGDISLYEADGSYQLIVKRVLYDSEGDFWKRFEETKRKLESVGLLDEARKRKISRYPSRIALITSESGAAIKDFIVTAKKENACLGIDLWSVPVQGMDAAAKIVSAINSAGRLVDRYDCIVIMRGGGSLEDLSVFNDEYIARAVVSSKVPTISAIGHERDITVLDFAADYRAATPTAAAVYLSSGYKEANHMLDSFESASINNIVRRLQGLYQTIDILEAKLGSFSPKMSLEKLKYKTTNYENFLVSHIKLKLAEYKNILSRKEDFLNHLNPENILNMGYALVYKDGKLVLDAHCLKEQENIEIKMKDGYINSFVSCIKLEANNG